MTSQPLTSFPLFSQLPTELRLKIYRHVLDITDPGPILKISYSISHAHYVPARPPPLTLSIAAESRSLTLLTYTHLQLTTPSPPSSPLIPIAHASQTLYLAALSPLLSTHLHEILYHFATAASRHHVRSLAIDLRVWNELCENGFVGVLSRMAGLREVCLVVEFGRMFGGVLGFLDAPAWRSDLAWVARGAEERVRKERERVRRILGRGEEKDGVVVRCVILTRGGEQS